MTTLETIRRDSGACIRSNLSASGRSMADIARRAGMKPDTLRAKLRGARPIYVIELFRLADVVGQPAPDLLALPGEMTW